MARDLHLQRVREVLNKDVVWTSTDDTISEALTLMVDHQVSALPVRDSAGHCVGMLSATDLMVRTRDLDEIVSELKWEDGPGPGFLERVSRQELGALQVSEVMTKNVATVRPEETLVAAAARMLSNRVHRLPVIDEKEQVLGVISTTDILRALVESQPPG